jgi:hypothetical protein
VESVLAAAQLTVVHPRADGHIAPVVSAVGPIVPDVVSPSDEGILDAVQAISLRQKGIVVNPSGERDLW